jgi:DNA repair protein RadD
MKTLRPYQDAALKSLWKFVQDKPNKHPLIVAPVAAGKSLLIAEFIRQVHKLYPRTKVVVLTHVKELLEQNKDELIEQYPDADWGYYCAGLNQKRLHNDITFASIQSVCKKASAFPRVPQIILIDECHLISHKGDTQYRKFLDDIYVLNPNCKVIGFTGTPFRSDTGMLCEGDGRLFDEVAYEIGMDYMINEGYWKKPVCPDMAYKMDVSDVKMRGGDYIVKDLELAINTAEINDACVKELIEKGRDRKKWLVFTAAIQHCEDVCMAIHNAGISVAHITSKTPREERIENIERFRRGEIQCLVNVAVLTTGFNVPDIDLLAFMRPTRSPVLYVQTVGRGVRPIYADGYDLTTTQGRLDAIANSHCPDCMVLDFGGVVDALGAIDQVTIQKTYTEQDIEREAGEGIMKICPSCGAECAAGQRYCYECSHCFIQLSNQSDNKAIVSMDEPARWVSVLGGFTSKHVNKRKPDNPPTMKVTYATMEGSFSEWICFEHTGFARDKAVAWHKKHRDHVDAPIPCTIDEAITNDYVFPDKIQVKKEGKYWSIVDREFSQKEILEEIPF